MPTPTVVRISFLQILEKSTGLLKFPSPIFPKVPEFTNICPCIPSADNVGNGIWNLKAAISESKKLPPRESNCLSFCNTNFTHCRYSSFIIIDINFTHLWQAILPASTHRPDTMLMESSQPVWTQASHEESIARTDAGT